MGKVIIWTPEQIKNLNEYQNKGQFHPFTCGNGHPLLATEHWAYAEMLDGSP